MIDVVTKISVIAVFTLNLYFGSSRRCWWSVEQPSRRTREISRMPVMNNGIVPVQQSSLTRNCSSNPAQWQRRWCVVRRRRGSLEQCSDATTNPSTPPCGKLLNNMSYTRRTASAQCCMFQWHLLQRASRRRRMRRFASETLSIIRAI